MKRLIEQEACEHGEWGVCEMLVCGLLNAHRHSDRCRCPGGSSREVTGEEVGWMTDGWGLPVVGYFDDKSKFEDDNARFLVIPLGGGG